MKKNSTSNSVCMDVNAVSSNSPADEVCDQLAELNRSAQSLMNFTADRLAPILMAEELKPEPKTDKPKREYPPLFEHLRAGISETSIIINEIRLIISRAGL